jgi:hypothetical protein
MAAALWCRARSHRNCNALFLHLNKRYISNDLAHTCATPGSFNEQYKKTALDGDEEKKQPFFLGSNNALAQACT